MPSTFDLAVDALVVWIGTTFARDEFLSDPGGLLAYHDVQASHEIAAAAIEAFETAPAFRVTIIVADLDVRETITVVAPDEWKARTRAIALYLMSDKVPAKFSGSFVEYDVQEV